MVPRVVLRVRKAVRRLALRPQASSEPSGAENEARWQAMLSRVEARDRELDERLARAERALNRLSLS